jgi:hypothetical protein
VRRDGDETLHPDSPLAHLARTTCSVRGAGIFSVDPDYTVKVVEPKRSVPARSQTVPRVELYLGTCIQKPFKLRDGNKMLQ